MEAHKNRRKLWISLGLLGGALCCCCVILVAVLIIADPLKLGIRQKLLPSPTPAPTRTPWPTPDPCASKRGQIIKGCPPPDFTLTTFDGQTISLAELRGEVVVINFWASWCVPCKADTTYLQAAWKDYAARSDVLFVGIDYVDTDQKALDFVRTFGLTYPVGPDIMTRIAEAYHITGVPETYIVDKDGRLAFMKLASFESVEEVKAAVDPLLAP
jgi:cytochrome c biogenesis protein CcmG/thiol:disulfide interchange protein DsbE